MCPSRHNKSVGIKAKGKKILIVEDEELRVAEKEKPDFVLLDILLPGDNGLYFLEQRMSNPAIAKIPVVAFSNFDDPNIKKSAFKLGVKDYLIKTDYTPQEVVEKVTKYAVG